VGGWKFGDPSGLLSWGVIAAIVLGLADVPFGFATAQKSPLFFLT